VESMNRQQRRLLQRQGQLDDEGQPATRRPEPAAAGAGSSGPRRPVAGAPNRRTSPRQFLHEVNVELRKVAWPTRAETANYATVVFIALAVLMAVIFGLDVGFAKAANFLFK
jgi:preprotein translocase subunit SecE